MVQGLSKPWLEGGEPKKGRAPAVLVARRMSSSAAAASAIVQRVLNHDGALLDAIQLSIKPARPSRATVAAAVAMARDSRLVPMALGLNGGSQTRASNLKDHILRKRLVVPIASSTTAASTAAFTVASSIATASSTAVASSTDWPVY